MKPMSPTEAQTYCTTYTKQSGSNFYYSFLFLPRHRREAMYTIYTFCRMVDTAVDDPLPGSNLLDVLAEWRTEVSATYNGHPTLPVTISLAAHLQQFDIPEQLLQELISGVEMDLTITRYHTFSDLYPYCYRVASVVGLICLKIFNTRSPAAEEYAINLGLAFQLTNILRDLNSDAQQNRIYLPLEDFRRFGYTEEALFNQQWTPALTELMAFECARARGYYQKAHEILLSLPLSDQKALVVAEIMRGVYSRILDKLEAEHFPVFGPRIRVSSIHRLGIAAGIWLRSVLTRRLAPTV
jgi:15-cis-phytoene synthase